jgi:cell division protein FtsN
LTIGLFMALLVYLHEHDPSSSPTAAVAGTGPAAPEDDGVSRPRFDFYAILPEVEVKVPDWAFSEPSSVSSEPQVQEVASFVLQAGAFKNYEDADRAKANLALLGISANIQRVILNGRDVWFRVLIGPFSDVADFDDARQRLVDNGLPYIVHRTKVPDNERT